jgi:hypothetical protein
MLFFFFALFEDFRSASDENCLSIELSSIHILETGEHLSGQLLHVALLVSLFIFPFPPLLSDELDLKSSPTFNNSSQAIIVPIEVQSPRLPLSFLIPAAAVVVLFLFILILDFLDGHKPLPPFQRDSLIDSRAIPWPDDVAFGLYFGPVADDVTDLVDKDPIQLRRVVADGRDEAFAPPAPVLLWVRQEVAGKGVGRETLDASSGGA